MLQPSKLDRGVRFPLPAPRRGKPRLPSKLMKTILSITKIALAATLTACLSSVAFAGNISNCDRIMNDVRSATASNPQKVLVIVEDAMVANESCACEIVKAAILASQANEDLIKQIVLTATNVSPRQSSLIAECAAAVAPGHGKAIAAAVQSATGLESRSGKYVKNVTADQPVSTGGSDYRIVPQDIRGVYLIQPSTGSPVFNTTDEERTTTTKKTTHVVKKIIVRRNPPPDTKPQSPSYAAIQYH